MAGTHRSAREPLRSAQRPTHDIHSGFDFFGAGNVGDDLMFAGFILGLKLLGDFTMSATTAWDIESQRLRFPNVDWRPRATAYRQRGVTATLWAGIGDTPLQLTSGTWFLDQMLATVDERQLFSRRVMVGIGAESEITPRAEEFALAIRDFHAVSTRDERSAEVISDLLGYPSERLFVGADLANIALERIVAQPQAIADFDLGLMVGGEKVSDDEIRHIRSFAASRRHLVFVANEVRFADHFEKGVYERVMRSPWRLALLNRRLIMPPYDRGNLPSLVEPLSRCGTVVSSRYHGLLAAAWSGSKVAAIARSSKVVNLAKDLGIPHEPPPITRAKLERLAEGAAEVPRVLLTKLSRLAEDSVKFCVGIENDATAVFESAT